MAQLHFEAKINSRTVSQKLPFQCCEVIKINFYEHDINKTNKP